MTEGKMMRMLMVLCAALLGCGSASNLSDAGAVDGAVEFLDAGQGADAAGAHTCSTAELQELEAAIAAGLDQAVVDPEISSLPDVTVLLETNDGRRFSHSHGASSATTRYESASTSKLVSAVVMLDAVDRGLLSLDSKAHDFLSFWTEDRVTLRHLLSFTSGFSAEPLCIDLAVGNFLNCAETIFTKNSASAPAPGTEFYYSSTHLQIAGLMVMKAQGASSWGDVFDGFKARTGLFPTSVYDLPSATNPRLAGGMHWTAEEYQTFLRALVTGQILSPALRAELFANQRGNASVAYSPTLGTGRVLGEDWAYGLGNWLECPTAVGKPFDCGAGHRNSSPGAYGAYPFIDFDDGYFGIVARQGGLGTYREGVSLFRSVQDLVKRWATQRCP